jgi:pyruvate/2-oxoglutarate dehydrogenase complex dihydrolipoamide dehydrogenase (E3) component
LVRLHVDIRTDTPATPEMIVAMKPDAVIVATGSEASPPKIALPPGETIITARDVLTGRRRVRGNRVVIAGGGCAGAQTAEYLAYKGHRVSIIEASPAIASDSPVDERQLLFERLKNLKVEMIVNSRIIGLEKGRARIDSEHHIRSVLFDDIVFCYGAKSNNSLAGALKKQGLKVRTVGDAVSPRRFTDAVTEGALAAINI